MALFAEPVEIRDLASGSAGVWSWGAAGAAFDGIAIVDLSEGFVVELHGTSGSDVLTGTDADEMVFAGAGRLDVLTGGSGADTFVFGLETGNGIRETTRITDFTLGEDSLDLGGAEIAQSRLVNGSLQLSVGADGNQILLAGITSLDDLAFV